MRSTNEVHVLLARHRAPGFPGAVGDHRGWTHRRGRHRRWSDRRRGGAASGSTWSEGAPVRAAHRWVRRLRSQRRHGDHRHVDRHQGRSGQAGFRDRSAAVRRLHRGDRPHREAGDRGGHRLRLRTHRQAQPRDQARALPGIREDRRAVEQPPGRGLAAGPEGGAASRDRNRCVPRRNGRVEERRSPRGQVHPGTRRGRRARRRDDPRARARTEPDQGRLRPRARDPSRQDPGEIRFSWRPARTPAARSAGTRSASLRSAASSSPPSRSTRACATTCCPPGGWPRTPRTS